MNLHNEIMNIPVRSGVIVPVGQAFDIYSYKRGHEDALHSASEIALKAQARIEELEKALEEVFVASGPVANCAYNVGQQHEDWVNISQYINKLDKARMNAVSAFREKSE